MRHTLVAGLLAACMVITVFPYSAMGEDSAKRVSTLMESMRDADPMVRRAAAVSLGESGEMKAAELLADVVSSDSDPGVRLAALGALSIIGGPAALPAFEKALYDPDERVRQGAAQALSGSWGITAHKALVNALEQEKSPRVRRCVAEALGNPGIMGRYVGHGWDGEAITQKALSKALKDDPDYGVRATAARMLGKFKNGTALKALLESLKKESNISVKSAAAEALGTVEMPNAVQPLIDIVTFEKDEMLIMSALKALKYYNDPRMCDALINALRSPSTKVRWQAIDALEELRSREAIEPLTEIADDDLESEGVRSKAMEALQLMGVR